MADSDQNILDLDGLNSAATPPTFSASNFATFIPSATGQNGGFGGVFANFIGSESTATGSTWADDSGEPWLQGGTGDSLQYALTGGNTEFQVITIQVTNTTTDQVSTIYGEVFGWTGSQIDLLGFQQFDSTTGVLSDPLNGPGGSYFVLSTSSLEGERSLQTTSDPASVKVGSVKLTETQGVSPTGGGDTVPTPCFASGTLIGTPSGGVAVEDLRAGDIVVTASGAVRRVKWIGHMLSRPARHPCPYEVNPVRISAGAFGDGLPVRDLRVSPGHALYIDGVLIPAGALVNGATIVQEEVESIRYFHVELESHDVLLAEGLPCESYLDDGNRATFANGDEAIALYGRLDPLSWDDACAPWVDSGSQVEAVRNRLHARAEALGWSTSVEPDLHLIVDGVRLDPCHVIGNRTWFEVPACQDVQLVSRADVPAHVVPGHGDRRRLGVAVSDLRVNGQGVALDETAHFGAGFYGFEMHDGHAWRWMDGAATLALTFAAPALVEINLHMIVPTWKRCSPAVRLARAIN